LEGNAVLPAGWTLEKPTVYRLAKGLLQEGNVLRCTLAILDALYLFLHAFLWGCHLDIPERIFWIDVSAAIHPIQ